MMSLAFKKDLVQLDVEFCAKQRYFLARKSDLDISYFSSVFCLIDSSILYLTI